MNTTTQTEQDEQLLKVPQVAEQLAIVPFQVRRLIWKGELPCVRIGRAVRVKRQDLRAFIEERTERPTAAKDAV